MVDSTHTLNSNSSEYLLAINYIQAKSALLEHSKTVVNAGDIVSWKFGVYEGKSALICGVSANPQADTLCPINYVVKVRNIKPDATVTDIIEIDGSTFFDFFHNFEMVTRKEKLNDK